SGMCTNFAIPTSTNRIFIAYGSGLTATDLNAPNLRTNKVLFDWVESAPQFGDSSGIGPNINADQMALPIMGMAKDSAGNYYAFGYNNQYAAMVKAFQSGTYSSAGWKNLVLCGSMPAPVRPDLHPMATCPSGKMVLRILQPYFAAAGNTNYSGAFQNFPDIFY